MKVVINRCRGGYGLSEEAMEFLGVEGKFAYRNERHHPDLVRCVEALGDKASYKYAKLKVVEIPDGTDYFIEDYDGLEMIYEGSNERRSWG